MWGGIPYEYKVASRHTTLLEETMPNTVRDWMSKPVVVVDPDSSVKYALTLMRRRKIHSVVVAMSEKNPTYGIVTSTDIRDKIVAAGRNPAEMTVREIMSGPIVTGDPEWTLMQCSQLMQEKHIHHLPIADESGALIGLISATDIFIAVEESGWTELE
jgi:CBS domain-containing protein